MDPRRPSLDITINLTAFVSYNFAYTPFHIRVALSHDTFRKTPKVFARRIGLEDRAWSIGQKLRRKLSGEIAANLRFRKQACNDLKEEIVILCIA
ncbi:unnamed protein product [Albugo candida]|uniref:Uncharacterized protein n=1 Tax=Albugo candida TaxID=65357 RepID=A0A024FUR6_9STRA|nr:unnamed protein product [Albugo candida]|eukprot:CCI10389.1 unnamed protein product [Albugo candida]